MNQPPQTAPDSEWGRFLKSLEDLSHEERQAAMRDYIRREQPLGSTHEEILKRQRGPFPLKATSENP